MTLNYPDCEVCKALRETFRETDITDKQINDYHESKIGWEDFPRYLQDDVLDVVIAVTRVEDQKFNRKEVKTCQKNVPTAKNR